MIKKHTYTLFAIALLAFVSCDSYHKDGDWDPMKWETNVPNMKNNHITVTETGGTYTFKCKNYKSFWIDSVKEDDKYVEFGNEERNNATGEWSAVIVDENVLEVSVSENSGNSSRSLSITLQAGNAFSTLTLEQGGTE